MQQNNSPGVPEKVPKVVSKSQELYENEQEIYIYEPKEDLKSSIHVVKPKKNKSKKNKEKTPITLNSLNFINTRKLIDQKKIYRKKMNIKYKTFKRKLLSPAVSGHLSESRGTISNGSSIKYEKIKLNISHSPSPDYKGNGVPLGSQLVYTTHKDSENKQPFLYQKRNISNSSTPDKNDEKKKNENLQKAGSKSNLTLSNSNMKSSLSNSSNNVDLYHKRVKIKKKPNSSLVNKNEIRQENIKIINKEKKFKKKIVNKNLNKNQANIQKIDPLSTEESTIPIEKSNKRVLNKKISDIRRLKLKYDIRTKSKMNKIKNLQKFVKNFLKSRNDKTAKIQSVWRASRTRELIDQYRLLLNANSHIMNVLNNHKKKYLNEFVEKINENKKKISLKKNTKTKIIKRKKSKDLNKFTKKKLNLCPCVVTLFYLTEKNPNPEKCEISTEKYKELIDTEKNYKKLVKKHNKILKQLKDLKKQNPNIKTGKSIDTAVTKDEKDPIKKFIKKNPKFNKGIRKKNKDQNITTNRINTISDDRVTRDSSSYFKHSLSKSKDFIKIDSLIQNHIENFLIIPEKSRNFLEKSINIADFCKKFDIVENVNITFDGIKKNNDSLEKDKIIIRENNKKLLPIAVPQIKKVSKVCNIKTSYFRFKKNTDPIEKIDNKKRSKNQTKDRKKNSKTQKCNFSISNLSIFIDSGLNKKNIIKNKSFDSNENCKITGSNSKDFSINNEQNVIANILLNKNDNYNLVITKNINDYIKSENNYLSEKLVINKINEINLRGFKNLLKNDYVITKLNKNNFNILGRNVNATTKKPIIKVVSKRIIRKIKIPKKKNDNLENIDPKLNENALIISKINDFGIKNKIEKQELIISKVVDKIIGNKVLKKTELKKKDKKQNLKSSQKINEKKSELLTINKNVTDFSLINCKKIEKPVITKIVDNFVIKSSDKIKKINNVITKNISEFKILKSNDKKQNFTITKNKLFGLIPQKKKNKKKLLKDNETEITDELNIISPLSQNEIYYEPSKIYSEKKISELIINKMNSFDILINNAPNRYNLIINKTNDINISKSIKNNEISKEEIKNEKKLKSKKPKKKINDKISKEPTKEKYEEKSKYVLSIEKIANNLTLGQYKKESQTTNKPKTFTPEPIITKNISEFKILKSNDKKQNFTITKNKLFGLIPQKKKNKKKLLKDNETEITDELNIISPLSQNEIYYKPNKIYKIIKEKSFDNNLVINRVNNINIQNENSRSILKPNNLIINKTKLLNIQNESPKLTQKPNNLIINKLHNINVQNENSKPILKPDNLIINKTKLLYIQNESPKISQKPNNLIINKLHNINIQNENPKSVLKPDNLIINKTKLLNIPNEYSKPIQKSIITNEYSKPLQKQNILIINKANNVNIPNQYSKPIQKSPLPNNLIINKTKLLNIQKEYPKPLQKPIFQNNLIINKINNINIQNSLNKKEITPLNIENLNILSKKKSLPLLIDNQNSLNFKKKILKKEPAKFLSKTLSTQNLFSNTFAGKRQKIISIKRKVIRSKIYMEDPNIKRDEILNEEFIKRKKSMEIGTLNEISILSNNTNDKQKIILPILLKNLLKNKDNKAKFLEKLKYLCYKKDKINNLEIDKGDIDLGIFAQSPIISSIKKHNSELINNNINIKIESLILNNESKSKKKNKAKFEKSIQTRKIDNVITKKVILFIKSSENPKIVEKIHSFSENYNIINKIESLEIIKQSKENSTLEKVENKKILLEKNDINLSIPSTKNSKKIIINKKLNLLVKLNPNKNILPSKKEIPNIINKINSFEIKLNSIPKTKLIINKTNSFIISIDSAFCSQLKNNSFEELEINKGAIININSLKKSFKKKHVREKSMSTDNNLDYDTAETISILSDIPINKKLNKNDYLQKQIIIPNIITKIKSFSLFNEHSYIEDAKPIYNKLMRRDFSNYSIDFSDTKEINLSIKSLSYKNILNKNNFISQNINNLSILPQNISLVNSNNSINSHNSNDKKDKKIKLRVKKSIIYKKSYCKIFRNKFLGKFFVKKYFLKWLRETGNEKRYDSLSKSSPFCECIKNNNINKKEENTQLKNLIYRYTLHSIVNQISEFCEEFSFCELYKVLIGTLRNVGLKNSFEILKKNYKVQLGFEIIENVLKKHNGVFMFKRFFAHKEKKHNKKKNK